MEAPYIFVEPLCFAALLCSVVIILVFEEAPKKERLENSCKYNIYIYIICEARLPKPVPRTTTRLGVCSTPLESSSASLGVVWIDRKQMAPKNVSNTHLNVAWCEDQEEVGYYVGRLNRIPLKRIPLNRLFSNKK